MVHTSWDETYTITYGLDATISSSNGISRISITCKFCSYIGRVGKRELKNPKGWFMDKHSIDTSLFTRHHESQHKDDWKKYQSISSINIQAKNSFFIRSESSNLIQKRITDYSQRSFDICIPQQILEGIILDQYFQADSSGTEAAPEFHNRGTIQDEKERIKSWFSFDIEKANYVVAISNPRLFHLVRHFVSRGSSFRMAAGLINDVNQVVRDCPVGMIDEGKVSRYVRFICAWSLSSISNALRSVWTYSIGVDSSMVHETTYFDFRVRLVAKGRLFNLHISAMPLFHGKTADALVAAISKLFDVLDPNWKEKLIGISTDGEPTMTGMLSKLLIVRGSKWCCDAN